MLHAMCSSGLWRAVHFLRQFVFSRGCARPLYRDCVPRALTRGCRYAYLLVASEDDLRRDEQAGLGQCTQDGVAFTACDPYHNVQRARRLFGVCRRPIHRVDAAASHHELHYAVGGMGRFDITSSTPRSGLGRALIAVCVVRRFRTLQVLQDITVVRTASGTSFLPLFSPSPLLFSSPFFFL